MPATLTGDALHHEVWLHMAENPQDMTPSHKAMIDIAATGDYIQGQTLVPDDGLVIRAAIDKYTDDDSPAHFVLDGAMNFDNYVLEPALG